MLTTRGYADRKANYNEDNSTYNIIHEPHEHTSEVSQSEEFSSTDSTNTPSTPPVVRHSTRHRQPPSYLSSYHCSLGHTDKLQTTHWCNLVTYDGSLSSHRAFSAQVNTITEPQNYREASTQPIWVDAMSIEIKALTDNQTWQLEDLPPGKKAIGSKWVYKVKLHANGTLERCKTRLVAKGYNQRYGIDYEETFSPVIKMSSLRCLIALAASRV
ncbi:hypothetical protein AgCh_022740 [Apium graveolens]